MTEDLMQYDHLTERAMRQVIREALETVVKHGLPGEHHLFITFNTRAEGVVIADRLKEDHPKEMTIILQHQFRDLVVLDNAFSVGLSFGQIPENLHIPYEAIISFYDPHVEFGLRFHSEDGETSSDVMFDDDDEDFLDEDEIFHNIGDRKPDNNSDDTAHSEKGGDNVVRIDLFRDK